MSPPSYSNLGMRARDLFNNSFPLGFFKLSVKMKTENDIIITTSGHSDMSGQIFASLESKYEKQDHLLRTVNFVEKWNSDSILGVDIGLKDYYMHGLNMGGSFSFSPKTDKKDFLLRSAYEHDRFCLKSQLDSKKRHFEASAVLDYNGILAGYEVAFGSNGKLVKNNVAMSITIDEFTFQAGINDGHELQGTLYQKIRPALETGWQLAMSTTSHHVKFGVAIKYELDKDAAVKIKMNNSNQIGLSYCQKVFDGFSLTIAALVDAKNFKEGGHQIGIGLEFQT